LRWINATAPEWAMVAGKSAGASVYVSMNIHRLPVEDALRSLGSTADGLSSHDAVRRLREFGPNRIEKVARAPALLRLLKEFVQFFSVILWVAAALAFLAEWSAPGQGMARIGYAVITVILVSGTFSFWQEHRVEHTLEALQKLLPPQVTLLRDGAVVRMPAEGLVPGDIVLIEQGDVVPADSRLIEAFGLRVNTATVTGESVPQPRDPNPTQQNDLISSSNILLAGTSVVSGQARAVVFATGSSTEFGKIAHLAQTRGAAVSPLRRQLAYLSRLIAVLAVGIGLSFFAVGAAIAVPFWQDFIFSIGIIVAMVPEGLLPTLTLSLVLAAERMAKRNVLIRHLASVETLGSATVICTDKTGTLTENRMQARELLLGRDRFPIADLAERAGLAGRYFDFFQAANYCHDLKETENNGNRVFLGDPMEAALVEMARAAIGEFPFLRRLTEIPFEADRMRHSVVLDMAEGPVLYCKGAPESVLPLCRQLLDGGETLALDADQRAKIVAAQEAMAEKGLRILALAMRRLASNVQCGALEQDLIFLGLVGLQDPPRPEVPEAISKCRDAGIKVVMVTGDHPHTAVAIAREIGLVESPDPAIITGEQLRKLSAPELERLVGNPEVIFARVSPDHKLRIVEALKSSRHIVAVTGDGVNDAPALKAAHIGVAMGIVGTDVARAASDMVLLDDNFASIVSAVEEGRAVFQNIRKFLTYVLVHNVAELVPFLAFALFRIPLALTPIQALAVDMGTDSLTALGLGVEAPDPQAMRRPPRPQHARLLNLPLALRAYLFLGLIEAAAAMAAFFFVLKGGGWNYGQSLKHDDPLYLSATTACLSAIIIMQIVNVFLCRSATRSVVFTGIFGNSLVLWGVVLEIALLLMINYTPWGNLLLGTVAVPGEFWLFILPFALAMLVLEELRKWLIRRFLLKRTPILARALIASWRRTTRA
jgi:calcium-translocating P-type ATPase